MVLGEAGWGSRKRDVDATTTLADLCLRYPSAPLYTSPPRDVMLPCVTRLTSPRPDSSTAPQPRLIATL
ncbi:hypothetical protein E2C01_071992 [Portunus trituberculatus]|uniref:Uncharacterized protein n=1 Tax=Portunus trituberculatus TaxID=210409 RepID=A0A5B7I5Y8_PORTR|nr:hypothetical protein [Portunus trituberculatus]